MEERDSVDRADVETEPANKVERVIGTYGLDGHGDLLVEYWTGKQAEKLSTRELAEWFNQEVLRAAIDRSEMSVFDGEVENLYRLLTDEDVSPGNRTETELKLEHEGVDVDEVCDDFVSHQTIYNYLTDVRNVDQPRERDETSVVENAQTRIQRLLSRVEVVAASNLESLEAAGRLVLGEFTVNVRVTVYCEDCERQFDVLDVLQDGGCNCRSER